MAIARASLKRRLHQRAKIGIACIDEPLGFIDRQIGFHGLRHTWVSLAVMAGMPLLVVAKNLGHSDTGRSRLPLILPQGEEETKGAPRSAQAKPIHR
jgi:integrase